MNGNRENAEIRIPEENNGVEGDPAEWVPLGGSCWVTTGDLRGPTGFTGANSKLQIGFACDGGTARELIEPGRPRKAGE